MLAKKTVSWLLLVAGALIGFFGLLIAGQKWIPESTTQGWLERLLPVVGLGFRGIILLAASFTAIMNRRRAGTLLLLAAPIAAGCLAFPTSFYFTGEHGEIFLPRLFTVLAIELVFYFPYIGLLIAIRNKIWGFSIFLILSVLVGTFYAFSPWTEYLFPALPKYTILCVGLGLFWRGTDKFNWPSLRSTRPTSLRKTLAVALFATTLVATLDVVGTLILAAMQSSSHTPDCAGHPLFAEPLYPGQAVFTARMIRVGHVKNVSGKWVGEWGIGVAQEKFWGMPWSASHLVLVTNSILWEGESYFVDGRRPHGLLSRFLPIMEAGPCARTRPLVDAALELRAAREGPSANGASILGRVAFQEQYSYLLAPPMSRPVYASAKVRLTGASTTRTAMTDAQGIYEFRDVPPENYIVSLDLPEIHRADEYKIGKDALAQRKLQEQGFLVVWNGTIEGRVSKSTGGPAAVDVLLNNQDRTDVEPGFSAAIWRNEKDGSFKFRDVPPGRYVLSVNQHGPKRGSPYAEQFYPEAQMAGETQVLEMAGGQHLKNLNIVVHQLSERKRHVRVTWPDGRAAEGALIYVAYEHTSGYEKLMNTTKVANANPSGDADIQVFGSSRVKIFAEEFEDYQARGPLHYSVPIELEADKLPDNMNLVLTSTKALGFP